MKFFAHREVDLEHLQRMRVKPEELQFVRKHLQLLLRNSASDRSSIEMALHLAQTWSKSR
jgi:hypothetical protein